MIEYKVVGRLIEDIIFAAKDVGYSRAFNQTSHTYEQTLDNTVNVLIKYIHAHQVGE